LIARNASIARSIAGSTIIASYPRAFAAAPTPVRCAHPKTRSELIRPSNRGIGWGASLERARNSGDARRGPATRVGSRVQGRARAHIVGFVRLAARYRALRAQLTRRSSSFRGVAGASPRAKAPSAHQRRVKPGFNVQGVIPS
jgi:hypothetical protein